MILPALFVLAGPAGAGRANYVGALWVFVAVMLLAAARYWSRRRRG